MAVSAGRRRGARRFSLFIAGAALAFVSACGSASSPLTPPSQVPSTPAAPTLPDTLPGVWRGYLRGVDCSSDGCRPERIVPFVLRVANAPGGYAGSFEIDDPNVAIFVMNVAGVAQPDGFVLFTGAIRPNAYINAEVELRKLLVRIEPSAGLSGLIDLRTFPVPEQARDRQLTGAVLSAAHEPFSAQPAQTVSGNWSGMVSITACAGTCRSRQGDSVRMSLVLNQSASTISGRLWFSSFQCVTCWLPISGTLTDAGLALSSSPTTAGEGSSNMLLHSFAGSLDGVGRLTGNVLYSEDYTIGIEPFNVSHRIRGEILWLKRDR